MAQAGTNKDAQEAVNEEWIEEFVLYFLLFIEPLHNEIGQRKANNPHQTIPAHRYRTKVECLQIWLPDDIV